MAIGRQLRPDSLDVFLVIIIQMCGNFSGNRIGRICSGVVPYGSLLRSRSDASSTSAAAVSQCLLSSAIIDPSGRYVCYANGRLSTRLPLVANRLLIGATHKHPSDRFGRPCRHFVENVRTSATHPFQLPMNQGGEGLRTVGFLAGQIPRGTTNSGAHFCLKALRWANGRFWRGQPFKAR